MRVIGGRGFRAPQQLAFIKCKLGTCRYLRFYPFQTLIYRKDKNLS